MAWQLIYTSAPRGLVPGHSGFCTVARSADLREAVTERLEQISSYHYLDPESLGDRTRNPIISAYRMLDVRGSEYHVLTRIQPSGLDFTSRTNHLAQHLLFEADELVSLPSPALLLRHWRGWLSRWEGEPHLLDGLAPDSFKDLPGPTWPARAWLQLTGDAGRAAGLLESEYGRGCYLLCDPGGEQQLLELFCETLQLLNPNGSTSFRAWQHTFTTLLQAEDAPADFQWRGCRQGSPAAEQALRRSVDLVQVRTIRIPNNTLAKLAREGPAPPSSPAVAPPQVTPAVRKEPARQQAARLAGADLSRNVFQPPPPRSWTAVPLRKPSLKTVGTIAIALVLLATLLGIKHYWSARNHSAPPSKTNTPAHLPSTAAPAETSSTRPVRSEVRVAPNEGEVAVSPEQLQKLDSFHWQDTPIYVVIMPELTTEPVPLPECVPVEPLLRQYDRIDLKPGDLDLRFNQESWDLSLNFPLQTDPRGASRKLSARGMEPPFLDTRFVCDYSGLLDESANRQPFWVQFSSNTKQPAAFSVLFRPAQGESFAPFRLLVVNERWPPRPLALGREFLQVNASNIPEALRPPLRQRLSQFHLSNATWQLRPFVKDKDGTDAQYLYRDWPADEQPSPAAGLDFTAAAEHLQNNLKSRQTASALLTEDMRNQGSGFDFNLALGSIFGLTNLALATFNTYAGSRHATNLSPDLYLEYLETIASEPGPQHSWLEKWLPPRRRNQTVVKQELNRLYDLCVTHLSDSQAQLRLSGPVSNYFAAAWKFLRDDDQQRQLSQEIGNIKTRLERVQAAYVSLCMDLAPNRWVQFVEFSSSPGKSP